MRRIGIALGAGVVAFILASCGTTEPTATLPAPEASVAVADSGVSLVLSWSPVDGAKGYKVECDGQVIADLPDTATMYKINGNEYVCKNVKLRGYDDKGNMGDACEKDLTMHETNLTIYSTDDTIATNPSWVKVDFTNFLVNPITQGDVDTTANNVGYFVYYYDDVLGIRYFKDASQTSVGQAKVEIAFTDPTTDVLAPSTGYALMSAEVNTGDRFIFWADDVNNGTYGAFDEADNFGVIKVNSASGTEANITVYIQKVGGLRWVKE